MKREFVFLFCVFFFIGLAMAETNVSIQYGWNGTDYVPFKTTADGTLKTDINKADFSASLVSVGVNLTVGSGVIQWNSSGSNFVYHDGSNWRQFATSGSAPVNAVMSFNLAECPTGWTLADGSNGTPDLRGIFVRGAGTSGSMLMANGTNFSATYGEYSNDSTQGHRHQLSNLGNTDGTIPNIYTRVASDSIATSYSGGPAELSTYGTPRTSAETAPASYALIYCVKTETEDTSNGILEVVGNVISLINNSRSLLIDNDVNITGTLNLGNGSIWYNDSDDKYYYYNKSSWVDIGSGSGESLWNNETGVAAYNGSAVIRGNLNVTGNISGGSPVKIIDGLQVHNSSGDVQLSVNKSTGVVKLSGSLNVSGDIFGNYTANSNQYVHNGSDWVPALASADGVQQIFLNDSSRKYDAVPVNAVMSFNLAECPTGWTLADGTGGTPDLRGIFIRGAGTSGIMQMANGTNFSATYGEYMNDSFQEHIHGNVAGAAGGSQNAAAYGTDGAPTTYGLVEVSYTAGSEYGDPRTGAETAPASYALIYCVKTAEDSPSSNSIWQTIGNIISPVNSSETLQVGNLTVTDNLATGDIERSQCPENWILVPGDENFTNNDFCVMKYEAKQDSNYKVVSSPTETPFVSLSQYEAVNACKRIGAHLCTAGEATTIARNIEATTINDLDDDAGLQLATGHSDNSPTSALAVSAGADPVVTGCTLTATMEDSSNTYSAGSCEIRGSGTDANGYNGTGQVWSATGYSSGAANKAQLRTFVLSNGNVIWDFSGNVWEWTDNLCGVPWNANASWLGWDNVGLTDWEKFISGPATSSTSTNGAGEFYGCTTNGNAFLRGGHWGDGPHAGAFALSLANAPSASYTSVGFRCCK